MFNNYTIKKIRLSDCKEIFTKYHYAHRVPSASHIYGLYIGSDLKGAVSYGPPPAAPQRAGLLGKEHSEKVLELNRLVLIDNIKNLASWFVSRTFRMLPSPIAVLSYSDQSIGHNGYIYQALNFIYCGLTEVRTDWKIEGYEHLHPLTVADKFKNTETERRNMQRPRKHRYVYFIGTAKEKREMLECLKYKIMPYPKKENTNYETPDSISYQKTLDWS